MQEILKQCREKQSKSIKERQIKAKNKKIGEFANNLEQLLAELYTG